MDGAFQLFEAVDVPECASLERFGAIRALRSATGLRHPLIGVMRCVSFPSLTILRGQGVPVADVGAATCRIGFNMLFVLRFLSASAQAILLQSSSAAYQRHTLLQSHYWEALPDPAMGRADAGVEARGEVVAAVCTTLSDRKSLSGHRDPLGKRSSNRSTQTPHRFQVPGERSSGRPDERQRQ
jgi:hypothetical protein